ncbi:MAG: hypothetical protein JWN38_1205 [Candidatus Saccharibacteria bacterium]|nr:hypothetical protein [Candidatus Saccharibacteria bacterium]
MLLLFAVIFVLLLCFGGVLLYGAPYLPTLNKQVQAALELADLKSGETLLELGCGDGKVLIAAAERGWQAVGYELNPLLALVAWMRTRRYGKRVRVVCGNFWSAQWPPSQAVFVFLLPKYMKRLSNKIIQDCDDSVKLVSFAFPVPGAKPVRQLEGVFLYDHNSLRP